jgi:hypothetical protein
LRITEGEMAERIDLDSLQEKDSLNRDLGRRVAFG